MFHLRFTPYDISGYTFDFLEKFKSYAVAYEDKDKRGNPATPHYHILIDTDYGVKTVRDAAKAALKIPEAGRGRNNAYYMLNDSWEDQSYVFKYGDIRRSKGYSPAEIVELVKKGKKKYLEKLEGTELRGEKAPAAPPKIPFQQAVIAQAAAEWAKYKRQCRDSDEEPDKVQVVDFVCQAMRDNGKGINRYLVKELSFAVLYDDLDYRDLILAKIKSQFWS